MKIVAIIIAILALIFVALLLVNPVLMIITGGTVPKVDSQVQLGGNTLDVRLSLRDADSPMYVVSLDAPRDIAEHIGLGSPSSFRLEPLQDSKSDPKWLETWNRENVRFAGKLELKPGEPVTISFPLRRAPEKAFEFKGQLEAGRTFFNSLTFFYIKVAEAGV